MATKKKTAFGLSRSEEKTVVDAPEEKTVIDVPEESMADPENIAEAVTEAAEKPIGSYTLILTYDGSKVDHEVTPEVLARGKDGKPIKRAIVRNAQISYMPIDVFELWGLKFPKDEAVEVSEQYFRGKTLSIRDLAIKATNMGCFKVDCDPELLKAPPPRARLRRKAARG